MALLVWHRANQVCRDGVWPKAFNPSLFCPLGWSLPIVMKYPYLGVILTPTLSWTAHTRHLVTRGNRLFAQCVAWCKTEGLSLRFTSTLFTSYVLPNISWGPALRVIDSALRRWGRFLLPQPPVVMPPVTAVHAEKKSCVTEMFRLRKPKLTFFSDSMLCLGNISDKPLESWENRIKMVGGFEQVRFYPFEILAFLGPLFSLCFSHLTFCLVMAPLAFDLPNVKNDEKGNGKRGKRNWCGGEERNTLCRLWGCPRLSREDDQPSPATWSPPKREEERKKIPAGKRKRAKFWAVQERGGPAEEPKNLETHQKS